MNIGIIGLGLIGGSFAKAYKAAGHTVYAGEIDQSILDFAILSGIVDAPLDTEALSHCDLILIALYPQAAIEFLDNMARHIPVSPLSSTVAAQKKIYAPRGFRPPASMDSLL